MKVNIFQEVGVALQVFAEVASDEAQLAGAAPNTPTQFLIPDGKIIKGIGKVNGKRVDLVGVVLQVEP